jgi:hypothetical protein
LIDIKLQLTIFADVVRKLSSLKINYQIEKRERVARLLILPAKMCRSCKSNMMSVNKKVEIQRFKSEEEKSDKIFKNQYCHATRYSHLSDLNEIVNCINKIKLLSS